MNLNKNRILIVSLVLLFLFVSILTGCSASDSKNNTAQQAPTKEEQIATILSQSDFSSSCPVILDQIVPLYYPQGFAVKTASGNNVYGDYLGVGISMYPDYNNINPQQNWVLNTYYLNLYIEVILPSEIDDSKNNIPFPIGRTQLAIFRNSSSNGVPTVDIEEISQYIGSVKPASVNIFLYGIQDYNGNLVWGAPFDSVKTGDLASLEVIYGYSASASHDVYN